MNDSGAARHGGGLRNECGEWPWACQGRGAALSLLLLPHTASWRSLSAQGLRRQPHTITRTQQRNLKKSYVINLYILFYEDYWLYLSSLNPDSWEDLPIWRAFHRIIRHDYILTKYYSLYTCEILHQIASEPVTVSTNLRSYDHNYKSTGSAAQRACAKYKIETKTKDFPSQSQIKRSWPSKSCFAYSVKTNELIPTEQIALDIH